MYSQLVVFSYSRKKLRLIHFNENNAHTTSSFSNHKIRIENCLFISNYVNSKLPPIFDSWFIFSSTSHHYEIVISNQMSSRDT